MMLEKDVVRLGFATGEIVGPITPEQAFNALPKSLKDKNKIIYLKLIFFLIILF